MSADATEAHAVAALLDTLLPGGEGFPSAGGLAGIAPRVADAARPVLAQLPADFAARDADAREAGLRAIEAAAPDAFARLVTALYLAYYVQPEVRAVLARDHGYEARPPQPAGHTLPPFDPALLDRQRQRAPFWRDA
jgi:hypothetical protein